MPRVPPTVFTATVNGPRASTRVGHHRGRTVGRPDVGTHRDRTAIERFDLRDRLARVGDVGNGDVTARTRQRERAPAAEAARTTGDERDAVPEPEQLALGTGGVGHRAASASASTSMP